MSAASDYSGIYIHLFKGVFAVDIGDIFAIE